MQTLTLPATLLRSDCQTPSLTSDRQPACPKPAKIASGTTLRTLRWLTIQEDWCPNHTQLHRRTRRSARFTRINLLVGQTRKAHLATTLPANSNSSRSSLSLLSSARSLRWSRLRESTSSISTISRRPTSLRRSTRQSVTPAERGAKKSKHQRCSLLRHTCK